MAPGAVRLRLSEIISELGWTQKELAQRTGISENSISALARGSASVRFDTLEQIIKATGKPISELIVYESESQQS